MKPATDKSLKEVEKAVHKSMENWVTTGSEPAHSNFSRFHVEQFRAAGATRTQVLDWAAKFLNPKQVSALAGDLDSYGDWTP